MSFEQIYAQWCEVINAGTPSQRVRESVLRDPPTVLSAIVTQQLLWNIFTVQWAGLAYWSIVGKE